MLDMVLLFADKAHKNQVRKYTGDPYITHPVAVAKIVATVTDDEAMIAAALLHDTLEDTDTSYLDLVTAFGYGDVSAEILAIEGSILAVINLVLRLVTNQGLEK